MCFLVFTILLPVQTASHFSAFKPCSVPNYMRVIPEPPPGSAASGIKALMGGLLLFPFFPSWSLLSASTSCPPTTLLYAIWASGGRHENQ